MLFIELMDKLKRQGWWERNIWNFDLVEIPTHFHYVSGNDYENSWL